MTDYKKPLPGVTSATKPFWDGAKKHELMAYQCRHCGHYYWPAIDCMACDKPDMAWVKIIGRGKIFTFTVIQQTAHPTWQTEIPYNVAWIKLDEGPIIISNIVGCDNDKLYIGMPVEAIFDDVTDEMTLPRFRPFNGKPG